MSKEIKVRIWDSVENEKKFRNNMREILRIQLALENYVDNTNSKFPKSVLDAFANLQIIRCENNALKEQELLELSSLVTSQLKDSLEEIGKEKFVFNENGCVEYIWNKDLQYGGKNVGKK